MPSSAMITVPKRLLIYIWAGPASLLGLLFLPLAWISGGQVRIVTGVIEVSGGLVTSFLQKGVLVNNAAAMTLGHVVLGRDQSDLTRYRQHERVHVEQYERWGPLMIPLYILSSGWASFRGRHLYWDNRFEQEAYAKATGPVDFPFQGVTNGRNANLFDGAKH